jgi:MFS family permease
MVSFDPAHGGHGALWLIGWRLLQAFGGAMLVANSAAILTDAFPPHQRGLALGIYQIAAMNTASVVFESATHLSRPSTATAAWRDRIRCSGPGARGAGRRRPAARARRP